MRAIGLVSLTAAAAILLGGCVSTAIKESVGIARGAQGTFTEIKPPAESKDARPFGLYRRFELGRITDDFGGRVPDGFLGMLRRAFSEQIEASGLPNDPAGKTLVINGRIVYYESEGMVGVAIGPLEEVVCRAELIDKDTGQVLATGVCVGRTTERVNLGVKKKAEGLAKAFVAWIKHRYPEPQE